MGARCSSLMQGICASIIRQDIVGNSNKVSRVASITPDDDRPGMTIKDDVISHEIAIGVMPAMQTPPACIPHDIVRNRAIGTRIVDAMALVVDRIRHNVVDRIADGIIMAA